MELPRAPHDAPLVDARELVGAALALGARRVGPWSAAERRLVVDAAPLARATLAHLREAIQAGHDPLGDAFCRWRTSAARRAQGATYTPAPLVELMRRRAADLVAAPSRVVEPGAGSGRFLLAAARAFPAAQLVGVELDPLAAIIARGNLAAAGLAARARLHGADFCRLTLPAVQGPTLYLGNPPYVRHHQLAPSAKAWFASTAARHHLRASRLAGLHVHFLLAIFAQACPGDAGVLVTAAEWLDVNYGHLPRALLAGSLGLARLDLLAPESQPFADALTTAAIASFRVGAAPRQVPLAKARSIERLSTAPPRVVARDALMSSSRWSELFAPRRSPRSAALVQLGELCRVHRGQATGANRIWIAAPDVPLPPRVLLPTITRARELFAAGARLDDVAALRRVVNLPRSLDELAAEERALVLRWLKHARLQGVAEGYLARHRRAWWAVELHDPAPILATYMARRAPTFVVNAAAARHLNIAHGLYPRTPLTAAELAALAAYLRATADRSAGRAYAGGLVKFEPREMERLLVPRPDVLRQPA